MLAIVLLFVFVLTALITCLAYQLHFVAGIAVEAVLISTTIAQKSLPDAGMEVFRRLVQGDMGKASMCMP